MDRSCEACGASLEGRSSRARFCSNTCRSRVSEGRVIPLTVRAEAPPADATIADAVRAQLVECGRESHPLGLAALRLAETLGDPGTPPSALAALAKQLEASLASAVRGAKVAQSPVERLRAQRDAKRDAG